jgi:glycerol-3-phosphate dehydrogenase
MFGFSKFAQKRTKSIDPRTDLGHPLTMQESLPPENPVADLFIIGGGINGCGIARDAAGRGLSVVLAEQGDLAQGTSSASTKLFHGGLRYLEYFEFRLVREALAERETLLRAMPHIAWPMRFVLPLSPDMRFDSDTPTSRLLRWVMPWARGRRPDWLIRLGLFLYDTMGARQILPATRSLDLRRDPAGTGLRSNYLKAFEYSDVWVQDARLVVLNARDAAARGATILVQSRVTGARREAGLWRVTVDGPQGLQTFAARALVNAAGPWVAGVIRDIAAVETRDNIRLVRGSHIVVPRLFDHGRAYFFQGADGRIIFAIPYEQDYTLIGTTDQDHQGNPLDATCTPAERDYLLFFANSYLAKPLTAADVVWTYSGVRPLYNDGASSATAATRDYVLKLEGGVAPLLNIFGGKITTYRRLAESALAKLAPVFPGLPGAWTAGVALPGGDFPTDGVQALTEALQTRYPFLSPPEVRRLIRAYGTEAPQVLGPAKTRADLGRDFGGGLSEAEVRWQMRHEWARRAPDVVWRRSKLGLKMTAEEIAALDLWMTAPQNSGTEF